MGTPGCINLNKKCNKRQWSALLLSLALLSAQTIAQQHFHIADAPTETCVVCVHGDTPAASDGAVPCIVEQDASAPHRVVRSSTACPAAPAVYLSRAPPRA
jgi:hypothetical protein